MTEPYITSIINNPVEKAPELPRMGWAVIDVLGEQARNQVSLISGPSFAVDVAKKLPTSIVATGYSREAIAEACVLFNTDFFRVYPNTDIHGVAYGGALKNIIAIACGMSDGLHLGRIDVRVAQQPARRTPRDQ